MTRIDQSDLYRRNSVVFKNFVLYSPDPPSAFTEGLGTRLALRLPYVRRKSFECIEEIPETEGNKCFLW